MRSTNLSTGTTNFYLKTLDCIKIQKLATFLWKTYSDFPMCSMTSCTSRLELHHFTFFPWSETTNNLHCYSEYKHNQTIPKTLRINASTLSQHSCFLCFFAACWPCTLALMQTIYSSTSWCQVLPHQMSDQSSYLLRFWVRFLFGGRGKGEWQCLLILKIHERITPM